MHNRPVAGEYVSMVRRLVSPGTSFGYCLWQWLRFHQAYRASLMFVLQLFRFVTGKISKEL